MQFLVCVSMTSSCSVTGGTICLPKLSSNSNMLYLLELQLLRIWRSAFRSQHMHQFFDMTMPWSSLGPKKILIMSFTVTITRSSIRSKTTFLTPVLKVWWIANRVLSTLWLNLGVPWHWHPYLTPKMIAECNSIQILYAVLTATHL